MGVGARVMAHDRGNRDDALAAWKDGAEPLVFLAVKMEEALDLAGDLARWQVLCKAPYGNTGDSRVARRLQDGQWDWYYRDALRTIIQGCGRVVRSPEDFGATYVADTSVLDLFERAAGEMPAWFAEQVAAMTDPDLPDFDPSAALAGLGESSEPGTTPRPSRRAAERDGGRSGGAGRDAAEEGRDRSEVADVWDAEDW
jgi:hypothetical protein